MTDLDKLYRLWREAECRNLRWREDGDLFFVSSYSEPETEHKIVAGACDCKGFWRWQYCCHVALYLYETDFLFWLEVEGRRKLEHLARVHAAEQEAFEQVLVERLAIYSVSAESVAPF